MPAPLTARTSAQAVHNPIGVGALPWRAAKAVVIRNQRSCPTSTATSAILRRPYPSRYQGPEQLRLARPTTGAIDDGRRFEHTATEA